jgi:hypothetical protein
MAVVTVVGDGTNTYFWKDKWLDGKRIKEIAPALYAMVPERIINTRTVNEALLNQRWISDFRGVLSHVVLLDFFQLYRLLEDVVLQPGAPDSHLWRFSSSGKYSTKSAYKALLQGAISFEPEKRIWKTWAPGKCRFFMWLVEHNRCWTSDRLAKRGLDHLERCPLCDQHEETINHLLVTCVFARQVWSGLLVAIRLRELVPQPRVSSFEAWWLASSQQHQGQARSAFNSLVILGAWVIWKHRNECVFQRVSRCVAVAIHVAREEALL